MVCGCTVTVPEPGTYSMHVESVRVDPRTSSPVLLLREDGGLHRRLPIWIGVYEAQSIALGMDHVETPRPNTHDLIENLLNGVRGKIRRVIITELRDNTYYASLEVELDDRTVAVDSRPSDAIAVAVRTGAPVFATENVLEAAEIETDDEPPLEILWTPSSTVDGGPTALH
jgi:bifunctional DNase/RNase